VTIDDAFILASSLNVLFIGEAIIDEYVYVETLYRPSKEAILAVVEQRREEFVGGVHAAAAHIKGWCPITVHSPMRPIRKKRYVQDGFVRKLFEVYSSTQLPPGDPRLNQTVAEAVRQADVVVVLDFGHGWMTDERIEIVQGAKFLAVNAQSNAGNYGFNLVTKYKTADYVCVDVQEARLCVRDQHGPLEGVIHKICDRMDCDKVIVTEGRNGASWPGGHIPALETHPLDTLGAGDCFMAYTAPLIRCGLGLPDAALVGCIAASIKTEIVGHRASVSHTAVLQRVRNELSARANRLTA
jgi:sugar/nucleoside kinase (ribokinase family)